MGGWVADILRALFWAMVIALIVIAGTGMYSQFIYTDF